MNNKNFAEQSSATGGEIREKRRKILKEIDNIIEEWAKRSKGMSNYCFTTRKDDYLYFLVPEELNIYKRTFDYSSLNNYLVKMGLGSYVENRRIDLKKCSLSELEEIFVEIKKATEKYYDEYDI